jgi:alanine racemase
MRLAEGEKVGYGHTFTTWRDSVIATLPIGYHDGYLRQFSNTGEVIVRGKRVPVVGRVCMDQTLVDVTDVPDVQIGDDVTIYGEDGGECISVEEMAARVDRIPYELTCSVGPRVRREFVYNGAVVIETPFRSVVPTGSLQEQAFGVTAVGDEPPDNETDRRGVA